MYEPDQMLGQSIMALRNAEMASAVITSLARAKAGRSSVQSDYDHLQNGIKFLDRVRQGYGWLDHPDVTTNSRDNAFSFGTAASYWKYSGASGPVLDYLNKVQEVIGKLIQGLSVDSDELHEVRLFFNSVFEESLVHIGHMPSPDPLQQLL